MSINKKHLVILYIILITILIVLFVFNKKTIRTGFESNQDIAKEQIIILDSYQEKNILENDPYVKFEVKYPYFNKVEDSFNLKIEQFLKQKMEDHKNISKENWKARYETSGKSNVVSVIPKEDEKFNFYSDYKIIQSNNSYISFIIIYGGFSGGAHGYENKISFNYDLNKKRDLSLNDLFQNRLGYLDYLSENSRKILKEKYLVADIKDFDNDKEMRDKYLSDISNSIDEGTLPIEDNFKIFTFFENKINIYFSQYQIGSYSMGMPEVEIEI